MRPQDRVAELVGQVGPADEAAAEAARGRHARLATPPGALGQLETVGVRLAALAGACPPPVPAHPAVLVAAGDHGVHARGVTRWPQEVTAAMVGAFCAGTAGVNAVANTVGADVAVLDVGVAGDLTHLEGHPSLRRRRVRSATHDCTTALAMSPSEACDALLAGAELAAELIDGGADLLVPGDMGIANTTSAACLVAACTGHGAEAVTGPGAGADDETVAHKAEIVAAALDRHGLRGTQTGGPARDAICPAEVDGLSVLAAVGGFEHAALTGAMLAAGRARVPVVLDGVSTIAAALVAVALCPSVAGCLVGGHRSPEPAAALGLAALGLGALVDAGMCLGEGTGGLLAVPAVTAAARALSEVATLDELL